MKKRAFGKLYKDLFYIPKYEKLPDKVFRCRMSVSVVTILGCAAIMASSAFALFHTDISTENSTIISAHYSISVDKAENTLYENGVYVCDTAYDDMHTFTLTASGNATTGYCKIQVGDKTYYTEQLPQKETLTLTVQAAQGTIISFKPQWGSSEYCTDGIFCEDNTILHSTTPHALYTVEPTAKLSNIAEYYGVSEEDILIYNNIQSVFLTDFAGSDASLLPPETEIKIPGVNEDVKPYAVPYAVYVVEPTATLEDISEYYEISEDDIIAFNYLESLDIWMELRIPNTDPDTESYEVPYAVYTMEDGAVLDEISEHYGISVEDIVEYNGIISFEKGFKLKIPGVSPDTDPYVAPIPEIQQDEDEFSEDTPAYDDIAPDTEGDTEFEAAADDEPALLYQWGEDYELISESTITLSEADVIIYSGEKLHEALENRITGIQADEGEYSCTLLTNTELLSLCFEAAEILEEGYLRIIIGESEYYSVQLWSGAYIRLDIAAPEGTEIIFEAYEGVSPAYRDGEVLYGDNLSDDGDGNEPLLDYTAQYE